MEFWEDGEIMGGGGGVGWVWNRRRALANLSLKLTSTGFRLFGFMAEMSRKDRSGRASAGEASAVRGSLGGPARTLTEEGSSAEDHRGSGHTLLIS